MADTRLSRRRFLVSLGAFGVVAAGGYKAVPSHRRRPVLPTPPAGELLAYRPPGWNGGNPRLAASFPGYTTLAINNDGSNRSQTLDQATDYYITIDDYDATVANLGGITLSGGRNVVIVGGRITVSNIAAVPTQSTQTALKIRGGAGTLHLEGLDIGGRNCNDAVALQDPKNGETSASILQIQNCRINPQLPVGTTIASGMHPDGIQFQQEADGYPGTVQLDKVTITSVYQAIFVKGPTTGPVILTRVNLRPIQDVAAGKTAHYLFWQETASIPISIPNNDVFVEENLAESTFVFANEMFPDGSAPRTTEAPTITTDGTGTYATWAGGVGITGRIYKGVPAVGDYCAAGVPGTSYVSPGYV